VLNGEEHVWFMKYIESPTFISTSEESLNLTGLNVNWLIAACIAINSAKEQVPELWKTVRHGVKAQATSSITIGTFDATLQAGLLKLIREGDTNVSVSMFNFRGRHDKREKDGVLQPLPGEMHHFFWFSGRKLLKRQHQQLRSRLEQRRDPS
jgi:hypothetical protein